MAVYMFEVADWCKTVAEDIAPVEFPAGTDDEALALLKLGHPDRGTWGRISRASADSAWTDGKTIAAWNIQHQVHGNYQARLRRE